MPKKGKHETKGAAKKAQRIGRDAGSGKFIPVKEAQRRKKTAVVETIKKPTEKK